MQSLFLHGTLLDSITELLLGRNCPDFSHKALFNSSHAWAFMPGILLFVSYIYLVLYIPDASRRPPPTPQDFGRVSFVSIQGNLSEGKCSLVRETAELVVK